MKPLAIAASVNLGLRPPMLLATETGHTLVHPGSQRPLLLPVGRKVSCPADFAHRPGLSAARRPFMQPRRSKRTIFYILLCCFRNSLHDAARFL